MRLTVLNVAYPFVRLTPDPVGGAEQVLMHLDRALIEAGCRSLVMAPEGSHCLGELLPIKADTSTLSERARREAEQAVRLCLVAACREHTIDVIHLHGSDFSAYLPPWAVPVLITLHLPLSWYPTGSMQPQRKDTWFVPVSDAQLRDAWPGLELLSPIDNGVPLDESPPARGRGKFVLAMGRICPEKGFHLAIEASRRAGIPILLAGEIQGWPEHYHYFEQQIAPQLNSSCRWLGRVSGRRKRRLLGAARCVVVSSRNETSSLVAREALAAGTPVVAFRVGALPDIIEHGVTGYIVDNLAQMAEALQKVDQLDRNACRAVAHRRFDIRRTTEAYLGLYRRIAAGELSRNTMTLTATLRVGARADG
jgi:glycosyltransferase involved in cell wall biosynthesis